MSHHAYTEAEIEKIHALMLDGLSTTQIAKELSAFCGERLTRNAIIGIIHRNQTLDEERRRLARGAGKKLAKPAPKKYVLPKPKLAPLPRVPIPLTERSAFDARALRVSLVENHGCRWPVSDPEPGGEHLFCGHPRAVGRSYCQHHARRAIACQQ